MRTPIVRPSPSPTVRHGTDRRLSDRAHAQARRAMIPAADRRLSVKARLFLPQRPRKNGLNELHPGAADPQMRSGYRNTEAPRSRFDGRQQIRPIPSRGTQALHRVSGPQCQWVCGLCRAGCLVRCQCRTGHKCTGPRSRLSLCVLLPSPGAGSAPLAGNEGSGRRDAAERPGAVGQIWKCSLRLGVCTPIPLQDLNGREVE